MEFEKAFLLVVLSLSVWSVFALLMDERGNAKVNRGFALLLGCMCITQAFFYSYLVAPPFGSWSLGVAAQAVIWVKGPLLLLMVRVLTGRASTEGSVGAGYWSHLVVFPVMLGAMLYWPQWAMEFNLLGFVTLLAYTSSALVVLHKSRSRLGLIYRGYPNSAWYWLLFVIVGMLVMVALDLVITLIAYIKGYFWLDAIKHANWVLAVYLVGIAFFSLHRPGVFFHYSEEGGSDDAVAEEVLFDNFPVGKAPVVGEPAGNMAAEALTIAVVDEKSWRELNESLAQSLAAELERLMQSEQLFRKNDLSLAELASCLGISVHQASELLNVHLNANFYDYINRYRLAYACELLRNPKCQWRVLDIAFDSGFSNKNSFYRYFREAYQQTPVEYRNRELGLEAA